MRSAACSRPRWPDWLRKESIVADSIIETVDLRKQYAASEALRGLTLDVPAGSICGFLGRNGAGKTTTMKILLGMTRPTAGEARVFGLAAGDPRESVAIRRRAAFVSEEKDLYRYMTVEQIIRFTAPFFPRWRRDLAERYVRDFDLPPARKIKALSRGMRTKLALLLAVCRGAELLIVDEPTSGLDPAAIEAALQVLVRHAADENVTLFFSTHQISEVEQIADRVVIIDRGRVVLAGALDDLRDRFRRIELVFESDAPAVDFRTPGIVSARRQARVLTLYANGDAEAVVEEARQMNPAAVNVTAVSLKEMFLQTATVEE
jgi:ABC-2 type transport system ATP-binding protein